MYILSFFTSVDFFLMKLLGDEKELHQKTKSICAFPTPHPLLNNKEINEFIKKIIQEKGKYEKIITLPLNI